MRLLPPEHKFYASWDDISTTKPWGLPDLDNLIHWKDTLLDLHNGLEGIEFYLVGGFAEYLHNDSLGLGHDADINFVINDSIDYATIKGVLDDSQRIALDTELLLDQRATSQYTHDLFKKLFEGFIPEYDNNELVEYINHRQIKKIVNDVIEIDEVFDHECVYPGLYKKVGKPESIMKKVTTRINDGRYKGIVIDLKKDLQYLRT